MDGESVITKGLIDCLNVLKLSLVTTVDHAKGLWMREFVTFTKHLDESILMKSAGNYYSNSIVLWRD